MYLQTPPKPSPLRWLGEALRLLVQRFGVWLGASFVLYAVSAGATVALAYLLGSSSSGSSSHSSSSGSGWEFLIGWDVLHGGFYLLFSVLLSGNGIALAVRQVQGEPIRLADFWRPGSSWGLLVGYHTLSGLLQLIGFVLCLLPGLCLMTSLLPAPALAAKGAGLFQAFSESEYAMRRVWLRAFGLALFLCLLTVLSIVPILLGLLVVQPLWWLVAAIAERDLFQSSSADMPDYGIAQAGVWPPPPIIPP